MKAIMKYQTSERWRSAQSERLNDFMASDPVRYGLVVLAGCGSGVTSAHRGKPAGDAGTCGVPGEIDQCSDTVFAG
jgi:hypothetical protein